MDPQTCLYGILDAIRDGDRDTLDELLEAMQLWNKAGGFLPQVTATEVDYSPTLCASLHRTNNASTKES